MEPAMALCAGLAAVTLSLGVIGSLPAAARRLGAIRVPLPVRPIAALLLLASLMVLVNRPRPAAATVAPPIVRLSGQAEGTADRPQPQGSTPVVNPTAPTELDVTVPTYEIRPGDSLWRIAQRALVDQQSGEPTNADIARFWPRIYDANRSLIGADPNLIFPGQHLEIPEV